MDKVKASAEVGLAKAGEAGKAGQAKLDAVQAKHRADGLLRELGVGRLRGAHRAGRTPSTTQDIERIVGELQAYEAEYGPLVFVTAPTSRPSAARPSRAGAARARWRWSPTPTGTASGTTRSRPSGSSWSDLVDELLDLLEQDSSLPPLPPRRPAGGDRRLPGDPARERAALGGPGRGRTDHRRARGTS